MRRFQGPGLDFYGPSCLFIGGKKKKKHLIQWLLWCYQGASWSLCKFKDLVARTLSQTPGLLTIYGIWVKNNEPGFYPRHKILYLLFSVFQSLAHTHFHTLWNSPIWWASPSKGRTKGLKSKANSITIIFKSMHLLIWCVRSSFCCSSSPQGLTGSFGTWRGRVAPH